MTNDILVIVKTLLHIEDGEQDAILTLYIDMTVQQILNYCNRADLPEELKYVAAQMVVDTYKSTTGGDAAGVSSISEAGRSVSFDTAAVHVAIESKRVEREKQLNRFRLPYRG